MAERGVNGASAATLNARFLKCAGCKVNVPKDDMLARGACTVCGRAYAPPAEGGAGSDCVAFDSAAPAAAAATPSVETAKPRRRRWVELQSRKGRTYYHNTETGEDRWDKPADFDAEAVDDAFVPFKNDFVKKAVLLEQAKLEATKLGVPVELVTGAGQSEGNGAPPDPLAAMTKQALSRAESMEGRRESGAKSTQQRQQVESIDEASDGDDAQQNAAGRASDAKKDGACAVM